MAPWPEVPWPEVPGEPGRHDALQDNDFVIKAKDACMKALKEALGEP